MSACTQPGCAGTIEDGYCNVCGMAAPGGAAGASRDATTTSTGSSTGLDPHRLRQDAAHAEPAQLALHPEHALRLDPQHAIGLAHAGEPPARAPAAAARSTRSPRSCRASSRTASATARAATAT